MLRPDVAAYYDAPTGSIQYVVSDPQTRRCGIIDPVLDFVRSQVRLYRRILPTLTATVGGSVLA